MKRIVFIAFFGVLLTSCWPTAFLNPRDTSMPEEWKVFFISPLENTTATAPSNYPANLSESLRTGIQNNTRLKLGSTIDKAEVQITGIVTAYGTSPIAIQNGDNATQNRLTISAKFTIITPSKGLETLVVSSTRYADYDANQNLGDIETRLIEEINQQITQDVINKLLSNW